MPAGHKSGSKEITRAKRPSGDLRKQAELGADYVAPPDQAGVNSLHRSGKSQHRRQPVNVDTERQRNPASVRIPPPCSGTIPEMRLDLFGLRPHRCNQLAIVKGGPIFGHLNPENRPPTELTVQ